MHIENQVNMAEAHTAFVVCKYINNIHIDVCAAYGVFTKDKDEYRIDIRLWDDIPEWAYQVMSGLELTRTYSIGIKCLQYIGDGPIEYVKECAKREFGFNTRKVRCVLDGDNVLIAKLFE